MADELYQTTEWLLQRLKAAFGGRLYQGNTVDEIKESRGVWREVVSSLGKAQVLATVKFILSGNADVGPSAPTPVQFKQLAVKLQKQNAGHASYKLIVNKKETPEELQAMRINGRKHITDIMSMLKGKIEIAREGDNEIASSYKS